MPPPPFPKILIANRGEIAVRIIRACREMGIQTVAVHSEADAQALHVRMADEAVPIGPPAPVMSYLRGERILQAALDSGAQAIHPGYGFLAENADFAQSVHDAGLTFIGPPPAAIRAMGSKAAARALMQKAGVPIVPGYQGEDDARTLGQVADAIGYPVLIKAAAGGGGKGMRIAATPGELPEALNAARREAAHAFGDTQLILEKYIAEARHVEFQILADTHGNTIHLFERECSIQRRHQKIIEETPSPLLTPQLRAEMGAAAVAAAQAVSYTNAGTVEFIVDPHTREHYFLEVNTRLQVEHPITELVTGLDLVQWQIRIAAGEPIDLQSTAFNMRSPRGHALECRLYAEDPANNFLPATGPVLQFAPPAGPGIRVDNGIATGDEITTHYDPMIAKIIVHAADRPAAIRRMQTALHDTVLLGLTTNLEFLQAVLAHPEFQAGEATTHFIEQNLPDWQAPVRDLPLEALIAAALSENQFTAGSKPLPAKDTPDPYSPWGRADNFRLGKI